MLSMAEQLLALPILSNCERCHPNAFCETSAPELVEPHSMKVILHLLCFKQHLENMIGRTFSKAI